MIGAIAEEPRAAPRGPRLQSTPIMIVQILTAEQIGAVFPVFTAVSVRTSVTGERPCGRYRTETPSANGQKHFAVPPACGDLFFPLFVTTNSIGTPIAGLASSNTALHQARRAAFAERAIR